MNPLKRLFERVSSVLADAPLAAGRIEYVAFVKPYEALMIMQMLESEGISCDLVEGRSLSTWEPMVNISVAKADAPAAIDFIREFKDN